MKLIIIVIILATFMAKNLKIKKKLHSVLDELKKVNPNGSSFTEIKELSHTKKANGVSLTSYYNYAIIVHMIDRYSSLFPLIDKGFEYISEVPKKSPHEVHYSKLMLIDYKDSMNEEVCELLWKQPFKFDRVIIVNKKKYEDTKDYHLGSNGKICEKGSTINTLYNSLLSN